MSQTMVQNAICFVRNGAVYANSRDVAACFEKRHDNVLRDIREIKHQLHANTLKNQDDLKIEGISGAWFIASTYTDGSGRRQDQFDMTRDGFTLLAMGFTGAKALAFKIRYIQRFNEMEAALRAGTHHEAPRPAPQEDEHPTLPPFHWLPIMVDSIPTIQVGGVGPRPAITDEFDGLTRVAAPLLTQLFKVRTDFSIELAVETHYARLIDMAEVPAVKKLYNEPGRPTVIHFLTEAQAVYCLKRSSVGRGRVKMMACVQRYEEARLVSVSEVAPVVAAIQSDNSDVIASLEAAARRQVATQPAGAMFQTILAYDAVTGGDQPAAKDLLLRVVDYFERTSGVRREMVGGSYYLPS